LFILRVHIRDKITRRLNGKKYKGEGCNYRWCRTCRAFNSDFYDGWNTLILESDWVGGQGAIAYTVANYPGFPPEDGKVLMENMEK